MGGRREFYLRLAGEGEALRFLSPAIPEDDKEKAPLACAARA